MRNGLRALVYRPGSLGDTLVSLPAIAEIRRQYPEHRLTLLTESRVAGSTRVSPWTILKETGWFDDVYFYVGEAGVGGRSLAQPVAGDAAARHRLPRHLLARAAADHAATAHRLVASFAAWLALDGITRRAARRGRRRTRIPRTLNTRDFACFASSIPTATGDALGNFRLAVPETEQAMGRGLLNELGVRPDHMLVGVGPGSGRSATAWPAERFAAVGSALLGQFRNLVLLAIGGSGERRLCDELCAAWGPRSHNLAGRLSVFGSASVLSQCATFIGNDSGPTHLAAMVGIPCVAIFSARNAPGQWEPLGAHHIVLEDRPECAGCMLDDCVHEAKKCLTRIETGRVVREAISLIESRGATTVPGSLTPSAAAGPRTRLSAYSGQTIAVTGAAGFLGGRLVTRLAPCACRHHPRRAIRATADRRPDGCDRD